MKIFISWSGDLSKAVALAYRDWLKLVITACEPFMSDEDIEKGTRGLAEIAEQLETSSVGLLCITRANLDRPWINYEAGAISKQVGKGRVMPFLIDLNTGDIPQHSPLTQFQMTTNNREDIRRMLRSINHSGGTPQIDQATLDRYFDAFWGELQTKIEEALHANVFEEASHGPTTGAMVAEILDIVRALQRQQGRRSSWVDSVTDSSRIDRWAHGGPVAGTGVTSLLLPLFYQGLLETLGRMPTASELATAVIENPLTKSLYVRQALKQQVQTKAQEFIDQNTGAIVVDPPTQDEQSI